MSIVRAIAEYYQEGQRVVPSGFLYWVIAALAVPLTAWELWLGLEGSVQPLVIALVFVSVLYTVSFLTVSISTRHDRLVIADYLMALLSLICTIYLILQSPRYVEWIAGIDSFTTWDLVVGTVMVLLSIELLRRCVGLGMSAIVYLLLAYYFFGHHLPGMFSHRELGLTYLVERMIISSDGGLFSVPIQVAATYAFLFILFGKCLEMIGGGQFFFDVAAALTGRMPGGVAKVAVVSSGLFGTISGSPAADVMTTGSLTIPAMKRLGYSAQFAGAVEAVASTGGALLPPVMGAVVFLMAEFTGITYGEIAKSAIFIALLYYFSVYYQVHLRALKEEMVGLDQTEIPALGQAIKAGWHTAVPFTVLVYFLIAGYTAAYVAGSGVIAAFFISWIKPAAWMTPARIVAITVNTVFALAPLVAAVAAAGLVIGVLNVTGLAGKLSALIFSLTGGYELLALILAALSTILLGMGMPVVAAYALVAVLIAPVLIDMGMPVLQTHLFLVYYSVLSAITPPIAIACYVASSIAEVGPMAIAKEAVKLGTVAFIIPFMFMYHPTLLLIGGWADILFAMLTGIIGVAFLCISLEGWLVTSITWYGRSALAVAAVFLMVPGLASDLVGLVLGGIVVVRNHGTQNLLNHFNDWQRKLRRAR